MTQSSLLAQVFQRMRTQVFGFTPKGGGGTIGTRVSNGGKQEGIYFVFAPDNVVYPYITMRFQNMLRSGSYDGMRLEGEVEIQVYGRPRSQVTNVELLADFVQEALLQWCDVTQGLLFSREDSRSTMPEPSAPADREVACVRLLTHFVCWPRTLTQYVDGVS